MVVEEGEVGGGGVGGCGGGGCGVRVGFVLQIEDGGHAREHGVVPCVEAGYGGRVGGGTRRGFGGCAGADEGAAHLLG